MEFSGQVVGGRIVGGDEQAKQAKHNKEGDHGAGGSGFYEEVAAFIAGAARTSGMEQR